MAEQFYYVDAANERIGPMSWEVLVQLHRAGVVTDETLAAPDDASEWTPFAELWRSREKPANLPPIPGSSTKSPPSFPVILESEQGPTRLRDASHEGDRFARQFKAGWELIASFVRRNRWVAVGLMLLLILFVRFITSVVFSTSSPGDDGKYNVSRGSDRNSAFLAEILDTLQNRMPASGSHQEWGQLIAQINNRGVTDSELLQLQRGLALSMGQFTGSLYPNVPVPQNQQESEEIARQTGAKVFSTGAEVGNWRREAQRLAGKYGL